MKPLPNPSRRRFLRGASATLALPYLEALAPRDAAIPTRAIWLYFPNGVAEGSWKPRWNARTGGLTALHPTMDPLARHRQHLVVPRGLYTPRGNGHGAGTATWLTGGEWEHRELDAGGASVDQIAGEALGGDCIVPALTLSARGEGHFSTDLPRNTLSWNRSGRPVFRETDPRAVFQLLFGSEASADSSLLDSLREQVAQLEGRVSATDRARLQEYLQAIRGLERRVAFAQKEETVRRLSRATELGFDFDPRVPPAAIPSDHGDYLDLMLDLVALALWPGASRVASMMLDHGQSNRYATFVPGVQGTWHAVSHWRDTSGKTEDDDGVTSWKDRRTKRAMYDAIVTWHHARVARFLDRLAALPEGGGTLLDHSVVVYGSSISDGHEHGESNLPLLVAGGGGGAIRGGRVLDQGDEISMSRLHLATLQVLGLPAGRFAEADSPLDLA